MFIPLVTMLWGLIIVMAIFQYDRERAYRINNIKEQLSLINSRIMNAYELDLDLSQFMQFLSGYFSDNMYEDLRVTVYDERKVPIYCIGPLLPRVSVDGKIPEDLRQFEESGVGQTLRTSIPHDDSNFDGDGGEFLFSSHRSPDGKIDVFISLPYTVTVASALSSGNGLWLFILALAVVVTIIAYITTSVVSKNVRLLRDFASRATRDKDFVADDAFPHDELGDISREIVHLYREKSKARKAMEEEHRIAIAANEEKMQMKKQLTNNISHELKTPVGAIKGYLDSIVDNEDMDEGLRRNFLIKAQQHMNRLCSLLNDLSTITRLEDGSNLLMFEPLNFHTMIFSIAAEFEKSPLLGGMEFVYDIPLDCIVKGNQNLLYGAVLNLIRNAEAYSRGSEIGIRCVGQDERLYTFEFWDNGTGVGEQYLPHLFERFFRIDKGRSRKNGGTGLGLPIVKNTIVAHGGTVEVSNREEGGLMFTFTLERWHGEDAGNE
ncbi:MAG: HAMP domain-containing histidine kinase [Pseudoflavonifractor sp.]|nr:HAMP domain-containing histidine kinase [Pseudoflavonifractor sp.]